MYIIHDLYGYILFLIFARHVDDFIAILTLVKKLIDVTQNKIKIQMFFVILLLLNVINWDYKREVFLKKSILINDIRLSFLFFL